MTRVSVRRCVRLQQPRLFRRQSVRHARWHFNLVRRGDLRGLVVGNRDLRKGVRRSGWREVDEDIPVYSQTRRAIR